MMSKMFRKLHRDNLLCDWCGSPSNSGVMFKDNLGRKHKFCSIQCMADAVTAGISTRKGINYA